MKRLFILVPDLDETSHIVYELKSMGVKESHIHICGGLPEDLKEAHLHRAGIFYTSHLGSAIKKGPLLGLVLFFFILSLFYIVLPNNVHITPFALVAMLVFGMAIGIWATGLIGIGVKDETIEKYEEFVKEGHFVMLIDTPEGKEQEVARTILSHHPSAKLAQAAFN
ncbi:MAG: hypothetical protein JSR17_00095 [Proteobacteria bacterium]|nr:hypothetical protein [Pseudomonadota bacterium]